MKYFVVISYILTIFVAYVVGVYFFQGDRGYYLILDLLPIFFYPILSFICFPQGVSYRRYLIMLWGFGLVFPWMISSILISTLHKFYLYAPSGITSWDIYLGYLWIFYLLVLYIFSLVFTLIKTCRHLKYKGQV